MQQNSSTRLVAESINLDTEVIEVGWEQVSQNGKAANVWVVADYAAGENIFRKRFLLDKICKVITIEISYNS